jgi:hypothetical protein
VWLVFVLQLGCLCGWTGSCQLPVGFRLASRAGANHIGLPFAAGCFICGFQIPAHELVAAASVAAWHGLYMHARILL